MRIIAVFLIVCLSGSVAFARTLKKNEVWKDFVTLEEDVIVPDGYSLTLSPGTQVVTNGNKIISYGKIDIQGTKENQVKFLSLSQLGTSEVEMVTVKPYDINTKILKDEFQTFKIQYAILWSLLFASVFFVLDEAE